MPLFMVPCVFINVCRVLQLPSAAYGTAKKLDALLASRDAWHHVRIREVRTKPNHTKLPFAFLAPFQDRVVDCPTCGSKNHGAAECPWPNGRPHSACVVAHLWFCCCDKSHHAVHAQVFCELSSAISYFRRHEAPADGLRRHVQGGARSGEAKSV